MGGGTGTGGGNIGPETSLPQKEELMRVYSRPDSKITPEDLEIPFGFPAFNPNKRPGVISLKKGLYKVFILPARYNLEFLLDPREATRKGLVLVGRHPKISVINEIKWRVQEGGGAYIISLPLYETDIPQNACAYIAHGQIHSDISISRRSLIVTTQFYKEPKKNK